MKALGWRGFISGLLIGFALTSALFYLNSKGYINFGRAVFVDTAVGKENGAVPSALASSTLTNMMTATNNVRFSRDHFIFSANSEVLFGRLILLIRSIES